MCWVSTLPRPSFMSCIYEAAFLAQGYHIFHKKKKERKKPQKTNLSLGNEGFGAKLGVNL